MLFLCACGQPGSTTTAVEPTTTPTADYFKFPAGLMFDVSEGGPNLIGFTQIYNQLNAGKAAYAWYEISGNLMFMVKGRDPCPARRRVYTGVPYTAIK